MLVEVAKGFKLGTTGVIIAIPVAEIAIALAEYYFFIKGKWKEVKIYAFMPVPGEMNVYPNCWEAIG